MIGALLYRPQFEYNVQINADYKYDKFLNSSIVFASMSSSGRVFHSLIAEGKMNICKHLSWLLAVNIYCDGL